MPTNPAARTTPARAAALDAGLDAALAEIGSWGRALRRVHHTRAAYLADRRLRASWHAAVVDAVALRIPQRLVAVAAGVNASRVSQLARGKP